MKIFNSLRYCMHKKCYSRQGVTLVEVLVTVGIVVTVLVAIMRLFINCAVLSQLSGNLTTAVISAQDKLEEIRNHNFSDIVKDYTTSCACGDGSDNDGDGQIDYPADTQCATYSHIDEADSAAAIAPFCQGTFNITQLDGMGVIYIDASNPDFFEVEVMVSWLDKDNRNIGEDIDRDGVIDSGEDINGNGKLDSLVKIVTNIARR